MSDSHAHAHAGAARDRTGPIRRMAILTALAVGVGIMTALGGAGAATCWEPQPSSPAASNRSAVPFMQ